MSATHIVLVGGPDSGKTNYIGRLWAALLARKGKLLAPQLPEDIRYVEETVEHLRKGDFAPRNSKSFEDSRRDFVVSIVRAEDTSSKVIDIVVPDVTGELWKSAVETFEITAEWMEQLQHSDGALLFVRVHSDQNIEPLDWVNSERLLKTIAPDTKDNSAVPTQVMLCELLRFLEITLKRGDDGAIPRVAVIVTAWDLLDREAQAAGPSEYLRTQYPLFAGKLLNADKIEVKTFGVSILGGDLIEPRFRNRFLKSGSLETMGYCVFENDSSLHKDDDMTYPVAWLLNR